MLNNFEEYVGVCEKCSGTLIYLCIVNKAICDKCDFVIHNYEDLSQYNKLICED